MKNLLRDLIGGKERSLGEIQAEVDNAMFQYEAGFSSDVLEQTHDGLEKELLKMERKSLSSLSSEEAKRMGKLLEFSSKLERKLSVISSDMEFVEKAFKKVDIQGMDIEFSMEWIQKYKSNLEKILSLYDSSDQGSVISRGHVKGFLADSKKVIFYDSLFKGKFDELLLKDFIFEYRDSAKLFEQNGHWTCAGFAYAEASRGYLDFLSLVYSPEAGDCLFECVNKAYEVLINSDKKREKFYASGLVKGAGEKFDEIRESKKIEDEKEIFKLMERSYQLFERRAECSELFLESGYVSSESPRIDIGRLAGISRRNSFEKFVMVDKDQFLKWCDRWESNAEKVLKYTQKNPKKHFLAMMGLANARYHKMYVTGDYSSNQLTKQSLKDSIEYFENNFDENDKEIFGNYLKAKKKLKKLDMYADRGDVS